jgi:hypothetical protein
MSELASTMPSQEIEMTEKILNLAQEHSPLF